MQYSQPYHNRSYLFGAVIIIVSLKKQYRIYNLSIKCSLVSDRYISKRIGLNLRIYVDLEYALFNST